MIVGIVYKEVIMSPEIVGHGGKRGIKLYQCLTCRAIIPHTDLDTSSHTEWHKKMEKK